MDHGDAMRRAIDEANRVVGNVDSGQLRDPTPCPAWDVRALLGHLIGGARMFALAFEYGSVPADRMGDIMGDDLLGDDFEATFAEASQQAVDAMTKPGAIDQTVALPFGTMPGAVAASIAIFDVTVHTWDLAKATGQSTALDPVVLETALEIGPTIISPEYRTPDGSIFADAVEVASDAPAADRLAAFAGRTP